ncbi:hypothetical protein [Absidia glauca]|uniref:Uncharacterized protein n=1 Tax=Absidia glauca TaxID=4829 RepID=A0A163JBL0_ABSGL|nr:hypothetical protein [Absidia glauca]
MMGDTKVIRRIPYESWQHVSAFISPRLPLARYTMVSVAMCTLALTVLSSVFCLFLFVTFMDDVIRITAPHRVWLFTKKRLQLDWPFMVGKISEQLTYLAEWEKQKRSSFYNQQEKQFYHGGYDGSSFATNQDDTFHDILFTITRYLNNYVHTHSKHT